VTRGAVAGRSHAARGARASARVPPPRRDRDRERPVPSPWLETLRLELREFVTADRSDIERLDTDPRVMKYIGTGRLSSQDEITAAIHRVQRIYRLYPGLGNWRATRRDTGAYLGWFSLKYIPDTIEIEVGYRLLPEAWGHGFATEGASALVRYGFDDLGLERIIGVTHPDNAASQRVLCKAGMSPAGWGRYYGHRCRLFEARSAA
jgi:RimJ/RimL family protein N-acetyltransferase